MVYGCGVRLTIECAVLPGMVLLAVNSQQTTKLSYKAIKRVITNEPWPIVMTFGAVTREIGRYF